MKEVRLTLRADEFVAVSQILIDMGVGFHVEPIENTVPEPAQSRVGASTAARRRKKTSRKAAVRGETPGASSGANRLREAIARTHISAGPPPAEAAPAYPMGTAESGMPTPPRDDGT